jgi:hypothetical protein
MSAAVRQEIAEAASTVAGVTCTPYYVQTTSAGAAYVRLDRIEYPNPFGGVAYWNVVLLLPQDIAASEKYLEEKVPLIREAIEEHLFVTSVTPQQLQLGSGPTLPCAFINGHREE